MMAFDAEVKIERTKMAASSCLLPKLDGFVFTEKLGSGTYATVYKAYRKGNQREVVAIKCVLKNSLNKATTENLLTEIEILKKIKHDYIVRLKDFQWDSECIYLIMEYCSGGDLSNFIRCKRALPEKIVKRFLQQLACALKFLHTKKISHMDLKPQNVLLSSTHDPVLKLADFGFAMHMRNSMHSIRGSPLYMAPEMICEQAYDASVDLWSVGVILYECLFGEAPFASRTFAELAEKIRDPSPICLPAGFNVSDQCRDLLLRLLQRDPKQRISFEDFFNHPFIDLEHMPSAKSLEKGKSLVSQAVIKDRENDARSAIKYYCKALEYLVPALQFVQDRESREALRGKVCEYMLRAEELKKSFKPKHRDVRKVQRHEESSNLTEQNKDRENKMPFDNDETNVGVTKAEDIRPVTPMEQSADVAEATSCSDTIYLLERLSLNNHVLLEGIQQAKIGGLREDEEEFEGALHMYQEALEILLPVLALEPKGKRRDLYTLKYRELWQELKI
ncbi:LOW QUALITY PROTEIN: serine/threonine-protein kinase ULK3-like [Saccoglossus kowalevskii]